MTSMDGQAARHQLFDVDDDDDDDDDDDEEEDKHCWSGQKAPTWW